jgi:hypothetical protein
MTAYLGWIVAAGLALVLIAALFRGVDPNDYRE